jgi:hypothetical protein
VEGEGQRHQNEFQIVTPLPQNHQERLSSSCCTRSRNEEKLTTVSTAFYTLLLSLAARVCVFREIDHYVNRCYVEILAVVVLDCLEHKSSK